VINNTATNYSPNKMATGGLNMQAYLTSDGVTAGAAAGVAGSNTLVPASSSSMGMLIVFVGRTSAAITRAGYYVDYASGQPQIAWDAANNAFVTPYAVVPDNASRYTAPPDPANCSTNNNVGMPTFCWTANDNWNKKLASAQTNLYGALTWTATAFQPGTTAAVGAPTSASNFVFTRVVGH
jgi:hypothetical protein